MLFRTPMPDVNKRFSLLKNIYQKTYLVVRLYTCSSVKKYLIFGRQLFGEINCRV